LISSLNSYKDNIEYNTVEEINKSEPGLVFVGINNPYVSDPQGDYIICNDVCSKIS